VEDLQGEGLDAGGEGERGQDGLQEKGGAIGVVAVSSQGLSDTEVVVAEGSGGGQERQRLWWLHL
jgi:hypothetical protein